MVLNLISILDGIFKFLGFILVIIFFFVLVLSIIIYLKKRKHE